MSLIPTAFRNLASWPKKWKVKPDLVALDDQGKPYTVRYEAVNTMLLNEFRKEYRKVEEQDRKVQGQEATITELKCVATKQEARIAHQQKQVAALIARLQRVSAQLETTKFATGRIGGGGPAPQVVNNP